MLKYPRTLINPIAFKYFVLIVTAMAFIINIIAFCIPKFREPISLIGFLLYGIFIFSFYRPAVLVKDNGRYFGINFIKKREIIPGKTILLKENMDFDVLKHLDRPFFIRYSYVIKDMEGQLQIYMEFKDRLLRPGSSSDNANGQIGS